VHYVFIFYFFNYNQFFIMKKSVYLLLAGALFFTACKETVEEPPKSLYVRLGGNAAIQGVIDQFITNVAGDTRINIFFADAAADPARLKRLRDNLVNQVGNATGGPEIYSGMTMKAAHKGMNVQEADFNALVDDLSKALDKFSVPTTEKTELLTALGGMKADIVETNASLYAQLGGNAAISAVIDQFIANVAGDARINAFFADAAADPARLMKLRNNLINQVGAATGGIEKYTGLDMKAAHKGMGVGEADFNVLVEDLVKSLDKFKVLPKPKSQLLGALAAMKGDIVEGNIPLYARLGMNVGISAVIDDFIGKVAADKRINAFFAAAAADPARLMRLRNNLINQVGAASGGTEKYTGLSMKAAHKGMNLTNGHFDALVEDLAASLMKYNVQSKAKIELLGALGGMRADIVGQ
jgi:truncated hemoglobin YjbI